MIFMKFKKLIAAAAAAVMTVSAFTAVNASANFQPKGFEELSFDSVDSLAEYLYENDGDVTYSALQYLTGSDTMENVESIWIPAGFSDYTDSITQINFGIDNISVEFRIGDGTYRMYSYFDSNSGKAQYNTAKKDGDYKKVNGRSVYRKDITPWEECYCWKQSGTYFVLRTACGGADCYSLCSAEEYMIPEYIKEGLRYIYGSLYYVQSDGSYYVGWKTLNGKKYFFGMDGAALTKNTIVGNVRYKFSADGTCTGRYTGWLLMDGYKYYYKNGRYVTGVNKISGKTYTFSDSGILIY